MFSISSFPSQDFVELQYAIKFDWGLKLSSWSIYFTYLAIISSASSKISSIVCDIIIATFSSNCHRLLSTAVYSTSYNSVSRAVPMALSWNSWIGCILTIVLCKIRHLSSMGMAFSRFHCRNSSRDISNLDLNTPKSRSTSFRIDFSFAEYFLS